MPFLPLLWSFLWNNKGLFLAGAIGLSILGYVGILKHEIHSRDTQITELKASVSQRDADIAACNVISNGEKDRIAQLESQLQTISDDGKKKQALADQWKKKFYDNEKKWKDYVGGLSSWKPTDKETDCEAATRLLHDYRAGH